MTNDQISARSLRSLKRAAIVLFVLFGATDAIAQDGVRYTQTICDPNSRYSQIKIEIPRSFPVDDRASLKKALEQAAVISRQKCSASGIGNLDVNFYYFGTTDFLIHARNLDPERLTWAEFSSPFPLK